MTTYVVLNSLLSTTPISSLNVVDHTYRLFSPPNDFYPKSFMRERHECILAPLDTPSSRFPKLTTCIAQ